MNKGVQSIHLHRSHYMTMLEIIDKLTILV